MYFAAYTFKTTVRAKRTFTEREVFYFLIYNQFIFYFIFNEIPKQSDSNAMQYTSLFWYLLQTFQLHFLSSLKMIMNSK